MRPVRRGFTLVEILVAMGIFLIVVVYAVGTLFFSKGAAKRTDRIDEYREMRIVFNRISRDLQVASRVSVPTYDFHSYALRLSDEMDRPVAYSFRDASGNEMAAEPAADDEKTYRLFRVVGDGDGQTADAIPSAGRVAWLRFTRLGQRLIGLTVKMHPREEGQEGRIYTATMSVNRMML